jgi:predicted dehydrogenase
MQDKILKVGLIGLGNMGRNHLRVLSMLRGVELCFIADSDTKTLNNMGQTYEIPCVVDPLPYLSSIDAVIICTPTFTHAEYINKVAPYVKNIFVEKPLSATFEEALEIANFAKENHLKIQIGFIERFNPAVKSLKAVLDRTSRLISLDFTRTNKVSARITDVDVVTDLMIHDIDLALYLNGPAASVAAHGYSHGDMIDFASTLITHSNGRFSRIQASRVTDKKIRQIEATCVDMFVDCDLLRKEILISRQSELYQMGAVPYAISAIQETVAVAPEEALLTELQAFIAFCRNSVGADVPQIDAGVDAMQICKKIHDSILAQNG